MKPARFWLALVLSFVLALALSAAQIGFMGAAEFMGQRTDALAQGLVNFYPTTAYLAVARMFLLGWALTFLIITMAFGTALAWSKQPLALRVVLVVLVLAGWAALFFAGVLRYPATFTTWMSPEVQERLYRISFRVAPLYLDIFAAVAFIVGAGPWLVRQVLNGFYLPKWLLAPLVGLALAAGAFALWPSTASKGAKPNVLIIGIDSLRTDRAVNRNVMPELAALQDLPETVRFQDHFVGVPRTFPSWVEMLQGRYAAETGVRHMFPGLDRRAEEFKGLGTRLRDSGYATYAVSDFAGDIFPRFDAGFQHIRAPKLAITTMIRMGAYQSFPLFLPFAMRGPFIDFFQELEESASYSDPARLSQDVIASFRDQGKKPVFTLAFYSTAHFPYAAPHPYFGKFADPNYRGPFKFQKNPALTAKEESLTDADRRQVNALYDGALASIDASLKDVFAALKDDGVFDETLIIVTADHGEDLYDTPTLQGHGDHLRGDWALRVPFIVKLPKSKAPERREISFVTRSIDMASTVAALSGNGGEIGAGTDLSPWIFDAQKTPPSLVAYSESEIWFAPRGEPFYQSKRIPYPGISGLLRFDPGGSDDIVLKGEYEDIVVTARHRSLVDGDYKLIYMPTRKGIEYELYDRRQDPENHVNLSLKQAAKTEEMAKRLMELIAHIESRYALVDGYVLPRY